MGTQKPPFLGLYQAHNPNRLPINPSHPTSSTNAMPSITRARIRPDPMGVSRALTSIAATQAPRPKVTNRRDGHGARMRKPIARATLDSNSKFLTGAEKFMAPPLQINRDTQMTNLDAPQTLLWATLLKEF